MIDKIIARLNFYLRIRLFHYLYFNYFCKQIERKGSGHIIPYKGAILELASDCRIVLHSGDLEIGCDLLNGSKRETLVRLRPKSVWESNGGCKLSYGTTLELLTGGVMHSGYFTMNTGSTIIAAKEISLGEDVMIARNVVVYDSDFHPLRNADNEITNLPKAVKIGDHVWLGTNSMVLKGVSIESGAVIGANTMVISDVPAKTLFAEHRQAAKIRTDVKWTRS